MVVDVENIPALSSCCFSISAHVPFCSCYCHRWSSQLSLENRNAILLVWNHDNLEIIVWQKARKVLFYFVQTRLIRHANQKRCRILQDGFQWSAIIIGRYPGFIHSQQRLTSPQQIHQRAASERPSICSLSVGAFSNNHFVTAEVPSDWLVIPERFSIVFDFMASLTSIPESL